MSGGKVSVHRAPVDLREVSRTPFALIVDQVVTNHDTSDTLDEHVAVLTVNAETSQEQLDAFAKTIGAAGVLVTSATIDVVNRTAAPPTWQQYRRRRPESGRTPRY